MAVAVGLSVLLKFGAFLLGAVTWFVVVAVALSLVADIEVPTAAVVFAVLCWVGSQALTRLRYGYWRSAAVRALAGGMGPQLEVAGDE